MLGINSNIASLVAQRNLNKTNNLADTAIARLSSGLRINSAKDDAAGMAIATRLESQVKGMNVAIRNANDATSLVQTAEGALGTMSNIFQRMRELAVQATNATYSDVDREKLDAEYQELAKEANRIATDTKFNGKAIIGADAGTFSFQIGADAGQTLDVTTSSAGSYLASAGDLTNATNANTAISELDDALDALNGDRSVYGAAMSRLEFTVENLQTSVETSSSAKSRILDADYAQESAALSRQQVLQQAGIAMIAQANQMPKLALNLLG